MMIWDHCSSPPTHGLPRMIENYHNGPMNVDAPMNVMQLVKQLHKRPSVVLASQGTMIRQFMGETDIVPWLELRHRAFARQRIGVRQWTEADFAQSF